MERHRYTDEEKEFIREYAPGHSRKDITKAVNEKFGIDLKVSQIEGFLHNYNIKTGVIGRFQKGHVSYNKGKKIGGWKPTQFKKGHKSLNKVSVGTVTLRNDGYYWIKVADPTKWKLQHNYIWEQAHGPIPRGYAVMFADGNRLNICLENLLLVSKRELLVANKKKLIADKKELTETGLLVAKVIIKTQDLKK